MSLFLLQQDMSAPIELIAGFVVFRAEGTFLAIRDSADLLRMDTQFGEIRASGLRTFVPQHHIVIGRSSFIAVALDLQHRSWMVLQPPGVVIQCLPSGV